MARGRGEGTVVKRSDGRYQASLQVNGKRRTVYGQTRQEVMQKLRELREWARRQGDLPDAKRTVADLIQAWLETCEPTLKPRTLDDYRKTCERYVLPVLGETPLEKLKPSHVQKLTNALQKAGRGRTAQLVCVLLRRALGFAVLWGWVLENVCDRVMRPQYRAPRKEVWTVDELRRFLDGTRDHWLHPFFVLAAATGARLGELLALSWDDVDWQSGTVTIRRNLQRIGGEWVFGEPKTSAGKRIIALPAEAVSALRRQKRIQAEMRLKAGGEWQDWGLVFTGERGQPLSQSTVQHAMRRECERLSLPPIGVHGLRHLHASLLLESGLSVPLVAKRLGHADASVTMRIYAHVVDRSDRLAAEALQRALAR